MIHRAFKSVPLYLRGPGLLCEAFRAMLGDLVCTPTPADRDAVTLLLRDCSLGMADWIGETPLESCVLVCRGGQSELRAAVRSGVQVFVGFEDNPEVLLEAVRAASVREAFCSRALLPNLIHALREPQAEASSQAISTQDDPLSDREREIAVLVAAGGSNEQVAARLFISVATVKFHLGNIYRKLGISRRGQLHAMIPLAVPTNASSSVSGSGVRAG